MVRQAVNKASLRILRPVTEATASEFFAFKECRDIVRARLTHSVPELFKGLTGITLTIIWHDALDFHGGPDRILLCPRRCCRQRGRGSIPITCVPCLRQHWPLVSPRTVQGRQFRGSCGVRFFRVSPQFGVTRPLTLVLQANAETVRLNNAVALLRWVVRDLETVVGAAQTRHKLERAQRCISTLRAKESRLHRQLQRVPRTVPSQIPLEGTHGQQIVRIMLDYIQTHYHQPVQLGDLAHALRMNASYLSNLFSTTTGVPFHRYLEEFRVARAVELLRDPATRIREVAYRVGYASPGQFWRVFRAHLGLSPGAWRQASPSDRNLVVARARAKG